MKRHILILDDSKFDLRVLEEYVEAFGYIPILTENGFDALEQVQKYKVDLLLVDVKMPMMNGFDFVRKIRSQCGTDLPVIMMSSVSLEKKDILKSVDAGACDFIVKPVDFTILEAKICSLLNDKQDVFSTAILPKTRNIAGAHLSIDCQILELSEMGVTVESSIPFPSGICLKFDWPFLSLAEGPSLKVRELEASGENYRIYLSFVGANESFLKKIRKAVWKFQIDYKQRYALQLDSDVEKELKEAS